MKSAAARSRRGSRRPGFGPNTLAWVRHGTDRFRPARVVEAYPESLEVEFVEAGQRSDDYQTGTVSLTSRIEPRVLSFHDGLVSHFGAGRHAHPWPYKPLHQTIRWIVEAHQDLCSPRDRAHPAMQAIEAGAPVKAIADKASDATAIVSDAVSRCFSNPTANIGGSAKPAAKTAAKQPAKPAAESTAKQPAKQPAKSANCKVQRKMQAPAASSADDLNNAYDNFFVACAQDTNLMKVTQEM